MLELGEIENLVDDVCYQVKQYGDSKSSVIIIGESHGDKTERFFQEKMIQKFKPKYILIEDITNTDFDKWDEKYNGKICQCDILKCENPCCNDVRERRMAEMIINCHYKRNINIIVIIGHIHAGYKSKIHEILKEHINYICIWNESLAEERSKEELNDIKRQRLFDME